MAGDINAALADLQSKLDVHIAQEQERGKKVDEMYKVLVVGNGVPSLKARVDRIEEHMPDRDDWIDIKNWVDRERKWRTVLATAVVTQTVGLAYLIVRLMITSMP